MRRAGALVVLVLLVACDVVRTPDARVDTRRHPVVRDTSVVIIATDGVPLAGTLSRPATLENDSTRRAAYVLVSGSGAQDRHYTRAELPGYQPFDELADTLAARGAVVLQLDDRGTGSSGGSATGVTTSRIADDVHAAVRWLLDVRGVDSTRVGIIGHSEGGLVALMVAAREPRVRELVLLATPSRSGREVARWQRAELVRGDLAEYPRASHDSVLAQAERDAERAALADPWMREWFSLEPLRFADSVRARVLVIHGGQDRQVPVVQASELATRLEATGSRVTVHRLPQVDHLLLPSVDGDPRRYTSAVERRVARSVMHAVVTWIMGI